MRFSRELLRALRGKRVFFVASLLVLSSCAGMGETIQDVMVAAPQCAAYVTADNDLLCGAEHLLLCTSTQACEARLIDQLREIDAPADIVITRQTKGDSTAFDRDRDLLGEDTTVIRYRAALPNGEVVARFDVATPAKSVKGWASAACFAKGTRASGDAVCRRTLAAFTQAEIFPVARLEDTVAPPQAGAQAARLAIIGNRVPYFDPNVCRVLEDGEGGTLDCRTARLVWRRGANTHEANALATDMVEAFTHQAQVVRRRSLPCTIDDVAASCIVLDGRANDVPAGHIAAFSRVGANVVATSCTWLGTDTLRPAPLCAAFFSPEGLSAAPTP